MMRSVPARLFALVLVLGACAPAARNTGAALPPPPPPPTTESQPPTSTAEDSPVNPATRLSEAPENWQLLDATENGIPGTGVLRAERELLAGREPARTVVVAVIDGGIDTAHVDLRANLWRNQDETPGNGVDDDANGFVDDVYGWNFIGGEDGRNVHRDTYEVTRLHVLCTSGSPPADPYLTPERCSEVAAEFEAERVEAAQTYEQIRSVAEVMEPALALLQQALGTDSLTVARVNTLRATTPDVERAKRIYLQLAAQGATPEVVRDALKAFESRAEYGFQPSFDPRDIVGDDYADVDERVYGNPDVTGPDASHGTHVAGIIGAVRGNGVGIDGVAPAVQLMAVRAVPDGDERDKDVANAIRYAVDNGAHIINMSFGKGWSPSKAVVDDAVRYAEQHGVLMVHAAGNDGEDVDVENNYPSPILADGSRTGLWIEVGATTWKGADSLVAEFSNYGRTRVDVFAPGYDILSATPGGGFQRQSGTSMAAPVVSGLAALLMAYHAELTAADVKRILLESATRFPQAQVLRPGSDSRPSVPFESLSATGGVVNAYEAIRLAQRLTSDR